MQCTYCGALDRGVRTHTGEMVCSHCGEPLRSQPRPEKQASAPAIDEGIDQATAAKVRIPELYTMPCLLVELGIALVGLVVMLLLGSGALYLAMPCLLGICALVGLLMAALYYLRSRFAIEKMLAGEVRVIHWTYSEREWQQFTRQPRLKVYVLAGCAFVGIMLLAGLVVIGESAPEYTGTTFVGIGAVLVTIFLPPFLEDVIVRRSQRRNNQGDAYISTAGIILGGWCISSLSNLYRVSYEDGYPAVLRFYKHAYGQYTRTTSATEVPVPRGREAQAKQLAHDFSQTERF
ncbi:MAG TPA: hypothetical protein VKT82_11290 [Ktedonobacterales bacterium]|nr:hypothetical protein [Ktedonobacterales bacterium]